MYYLAARFATENKLEDSCWTREHDMIVPDILNETSGLDCKAIMYSLLTYVQVMAQQFGT